MSWDLAAIGNYVELDETSEALLNSPQAPIVLLPRKQDTALAVCIAPGQSRLGLMLPYTPLHLLLLEPAPSYPGALVMTSGNLSEEPIIHDNQTARERLAGIADAFLLHDRPIEERIDDSVFTIFDGKPYPVRRHAATPPTPSGWQILSCRFWPSDHR